MKFEVEGQPSSDRESIARDKWTTFVFALEPQTADLPEPYRTYFQGISKLLIGKDISLGYIHKPAMGSFIQDLELITQLLYYCDIYDLDFILRETTKFLGRLGLSMSEEAMFTREGPMSHSYATQKLVSVASRPESRKGIIKRGTPPSEGEYVTEAY